MENHVPYIAQIGLNELYRLIVDHLILCPHDSHFTYRATSISRGKISIYYAHYLCTVNQFKKQQRKLEHLTASQKNFVIITQLTDIDILTLGLLRHWLLRTFQSQHKP
jgi:hypothetical protein